MFSQRLLGFAILKAAESPINPSAEDLQDNPEVLHPMSPASRVPLPAGTSKTMGGAVRAIAKSRIRVFATGLDPPTPARLVCTRYPEDFRGDLLRRDKLVRVSGVRARGSERGCSGLLPRGRDADTEYSRCLLSASDWSAAREFGFWMVAGGGLTFWRTADMGAVLSHMLQDATCDARDASTAIKGPRERRHSVSVRDTSEFSGNVIALHLPRV